MSKSVVTAATAGRAKTLSRAKVLRGKETNHKPAAEEAAAVVQHDAQAIHLAPVHGDALQADAGLTLSVTDSISLAGDFSFAGVMAEAADSAALSTASAADFMGTTSLLQDASGDTGGDGGNDNLPLIIGGVVLVGAGIAIAASGDDDDTTSPTPTPTPTPPANQPPVVTATQAVATDENVAKTFTVSATDPNNDTLTYTAAGAKNGTVAAGTKAGDFTYTPNKNFDGTDSFTVTVSDGKGGTATQTVNVTIKDVPAGPTTAAVTVNAAGSVTDADNVNTTYTVQLGNYTYTIAGFDAGGDKIVSPAGVPVSLNNSSFTDGKVDIEYASGGQVATISLTGLTNAQDAQLFGTADLNKVFGAGTFA